MDAMTAQARRFYHHVHNGGVLKEHDVASMVEYMECKDAEIARLTSERDQALASVGAVIKKAYGYGAMDIPAAILEINPDATAALNEMLADAWDEGWEACVRDNHIDTLTPNPYRKDSS